MTNTFSLLLSLMYNKGTVELRNSTIVISNFFLKCQHYFLVSVLVIDLQLENA